MTLQFGSEESRLIKCHQITWLHSTANLHSHLTIEASLVIPRPNFLSSSHFPNTYYIIRLSTSPTASSQTIHRDATVSKSLHSSRRPRVISLFSVRINTKRLPSPPHWLNAKRSCRDASKRRPSHFRVRSVRLASHYRGGTASSPVGRLAPVFDTDQRRDWSLLKRTSLLSGCLRFVSAYITAVLTDFSIFFSRSTQDSRY